MRRLQDFIINDHDIFGPGTDLVVSLVAVLVIMLAVNADSFKRILQGLESSYEEEKEQKQKFMRENEDLKNREREGQLDIKRVQDNQRQIVERIATKYNTTPQRIGENEYGLSINNSFSQNDIIIQNDVTLQRIRFGSHILFDEDDAKLKSNGKQVLTIVGNVFKQKLDAIKEIQIQGHADKQKTLKFDSNLELAAHRAIAVLKFLRDDLDIDPTRHIMSATSFGEYKPVQRTYSDMYYNKYRLEFDNDTDEKRRLNRRIDIVLIYWQKQ